MNTKTESNALREVREWKAACNREVAGMATGEAVSKRLKDAEENARKAGFTPAERMIDRVAEAPDGYGIAGRGRSSD